MLEATSKKDKSFKLLLEIIAEQKKQTPEKFKFFDGALAEIQVKGLEQLIMLSLYQGHIVGCMGFVYNEIHEKVISLDLAYLGETLQEQREFRKDFLNFCNMLDKLYKKIELNIVPQSPAYSLAIKCFKKFNFRKVGVFRKTRKLNKVFYDVEYWEKEER